jgi:hypothetical protein
MRSSFALIVLILIAFAASQTCRAQSFQFGLPPGPVRRSHFFAFHIFTGHSPVFRGSRYITLLNR